jgi:acyl-CoA reductase-like NAD-dependent aldehyde dehydrogenase/hypothetical membrane protein
MIPIDSFSALLDTYSVDHATVDQMIARALVAQRQIERWNEAQIDQLLLALAQTLADHAEDLAVAAAHETGMGNVRDKTFKNRIASLGTYERLVGQVGHGLIGVDPQRQIAEIASPVGIVVGLVPATHPVATFIFKALIAIKGRNALVVSPSRRAQHVSNQVGALIQQVLIQQGAPADLVQWVQSGGRETSAALMSHPDVGLVLATGGAAMVKAAYRSGTPAIGVGPGNAPALIAADADVAHVAHSVVASKPFDNGLICGAENSLVVVTDLREGLIAELERHGAAVLRSAEAARLHNAVVDPQSQRFKPRVIGQPAATLAAWGNIQRPFEIQLLVVPTASVAEANYLAAEKLAPVVGLFTVADAEEGLKICRALLEIGGAGHTAIIHTQDSQLIGRFAAAMPASRILVNSPGTQGVLGLTTGLELSMTLGCGTWGGTSTTESITYRHLLNIKRVAYSTAEFVGMDASQLQAEIQPLAHSSRPASSPAQHIDRAASFNRWLAGLGMAGAVYALVTWLAFVFLRPDLNPVTHFLSEYVNGAYGSLMTATLYGLSLTWATLALGLYRTIPPPGRSRLGLGALSLCSIGSLGTAIFPTDPIGVAPTTTSAIHWYMALLFFTCIGPAMLAHAAAWQRDYTWMSLSRAAFVLAGAVLVGLIVLQFGPPALSGLAQRWTLVSALAWQLLAGWRLYRLASGRRYAEI